MSVSLVVGGVSYTYPQTGDQSWGDQASLWAQAVTSSMLQKSGGAFTLTADVNFGATFGLISAYFTSRTANAAHTGAVRLANADGIAFRNSGNSADILLTPHADGILQYNSVDLVNLSATQTLTNKTIAGGSNTISGLTNSNLSGSAAITNANLAAMAANTVKANATGGSATPTDVAMTSANTNSAVVVRDGSGNFAATTITAALTGIASGNTTYSANNHGVVLSGSANAMSVLAPNASTAFPLVSGGASANPSWALLTVAGGGTGSATVVSTPAATTWAGWDANKNISAQNHIEGYRTQATAASTLALVVGDAFLQYFTGSTASQVVTMPVASGLALGMQWLLTNNSTQTISVQSSGANVIQVMAANTQLLLTCILISGTGTASWSWIYSPNGTAGLPAVNPMTTGGDVIYGGAGGTPTRLANGTPGQVLQSAGGTSAPAWTTLKVPTQQLFTATGTTVGYVFTVNSVTTAPLAGDTYTNNGHTYTVVGSTNTKTLIWTTQTLAPLASGTLTRTAGAGDATIAFTVAQTTATYTTPAGCTLLKVTVQGGGGAGGGVSSSATTSAGGGGGGGGGTSIKWITSPGASYYYVIGLGGTAGASGNNSGNTGLLSGFGSGTTFYTGMGGAGGSGGAASAIGVNNQPVVGGTASGGDLNISGGGGGYGITLTTGNAISGAGGNSILGSGGYAFSGSNSGIAGNNYGGGGSGGCQQSNGGAQTGAVGAAGVVTVEEFYQ